ncbi:hypothetical protein ACFV98_02540 [Streptomyces violascens]|uniref:hypothetical protein n=1 Tax=Streptomyces violascens TaxID=67381 RepID=UPI0036671B14
MSVTLAKTPRALTVLMQHGEVHDVIPTPATEGEYDTLVIAVGFGLCLDLYDVMAIDRYEATIRALAAHDRATAIENYMDHVGASRDTARAVYRDCRTWARALTPEGRASWFGSEGLMHFAPLKRFALIEAMREFGEPTA